MFFQLGGSDTRAVQEERRTRLKLHIEQATNPKETNLNQRTLDAVEKVLADNPEEVQ